MDIHVDSLSMNQLDRIEAAMGAILTSEWILLAEARLNADSKGSSADVSKDSIVRLDRLTKLSQAFPAVEVLRVKCKPICFGSVIVHDIVYFNCCLRLVPAGRRERAAFSFIFRSAPDASFAVTAFMHLIGRERTGPSICRGSTPDALIRIGRMPMPFIWRERTGIAVRRMITICAISGCHDVSIYEEERWDRTILPSS